MEMSNEDKLDHLFSQFYGCDEVIVVGLTYGDGGVVRVGATMPYVPDIAWALDLAKLQLFETLGGLDD